MPKVYLSKTERLSDRLASWIFGQMKLQGITQKQLAGELQITQQGLSYKLRHRQFSYSDFITIIDVFKPEQNELEWLIRG